MIFIDDNAFKLILNSRSVRSVHHGIAVKDNHVKNSFRRDSLLFNFDKINEQKESTEN